MNFIYPSFKLSFFFFLINFIYYPVQSNNIQTLSLPLNPISHDFPLPSKITVESISNLQFDDKGLLYLTSSSYLWIYNGNTWQQVYAGYNPKVTISGQGNILLFSGNKLYKLIHNNRNKYQFSETNLQIPKDEDIKEARFIGDKLIILTDSNVYSSSEDELDLILSFSDESRLFLDTGSIVFTDHTGLMILKNDLSIEGFKEIPEIIDDVVYSENGFWFLSDKRRELALYDESLENLLFKYTFDREISDFTFKNRNEVYVQFKDNSVARLNIENGKLNTQEINFQDDEYEAILVNKTGRVWIWGKRKIKILDFNSGIFNVNSSFNGFPEDFAVLDNQLYLLIQNSIFNQAGRKIFTSEERINNIFSKDRKLLLSRGEDVLELDPVTSNFVLHEMNASYADCHDYANYLFKTSDSVFVYRYGEGNWEKMISQEIEDSEYCIFSSWLCSASDRVLSLTHLQTQKKEFYKLPEVFGKEYPIKLLSAGDKLILYNSNYVYSYNPNIKNIKEENLLFSKSIRIEDIVSLDSSHLIVKTRSYNEPGAFIILNTEKNQFRYFNIPSFPAYFSKYKVENLNEDYFFLGSEKGLELIEKDTRPRTTASFYPVLSLVIHGEDTLLDTHGYNPWEEEIISEPVFGFFTGKLFKIRFTDTDYLYPNSFYQYKLNEGSVWSGWMSGNELSFENFQSGKYQLFLKLMNSQGEISEVAVYNISIPRHFLLKWPVISLFIFLILIIAFILYKRLKLVNLRIDTEDDEAKAYHREETMNRDFPVAAPGFEMNKRKRERETRWDKYEMATVLFSDIQGFTKIAEEMNPENLIDELDRFFFHFDSVVEKHNIEKIKTIGDAYMAAGGIPQKNRSNPIEVVLAALEMQQYMQDLKKTKIDFWDLRIGIHTGPVIAGIVGHKKRSYDIWGDTVNTASRMESSGEAGKVNISGETYALVKEYFLCEYRGKLPVKYKGNLDMYFVKGLRPELSINLEGIPNRKFYLKLHLLRLQDLEEHVFKKLEEESPATHYFHTPEYAHHLYTFSELLSKAENLDLEETLLIKASVLLLITGFVENYHNPEKAASKISLEILKDFHFSQNQIQTISNLILASKSPPEPKTLLEKIMVDIRYEYLGRADYIELYKLLYQEQKANQEELDFNTWKEDQIKLLRNHKFYTSGARRLSEIPFNEQLERMEEEEEE